MGGHLILSYDKTNVPIAKKETCTIVAEISNIWPGSRNALDIVMAIKDHTVAINAAIIPQAALYYLLIITLNFIQSFLFHKYFFLILTSNSEPKVLEG